MKKFVVLSAMMAVLMMAASANATIVGIAWWGGNSSQDNTLAAGDNVGGQAGWNNLALGDQGGSGGTLLANAPDSAGTATSVNYVWSMGNNNGGTLYCGGGSEKSPPYSLEDRLIEGAPYFASQASGYGLTNLDTINGGTNDVWIYGKTDLTGWTYGDAYRQGSNTYTVTSDQVSAFGTGGYVTHITGYTSSVFYIDRMTNGPWAAAIQVGQTGNGAVPEPAGLGLIGLALLAVRKRRS